MAPLLTKSTLLTALLPVLVNASCDNVQTGYQCQPEISHYWGQYSGFFSVDSDISTDVPAHCRLTFAQMLSRHGARDPTASKTTKYNSTITALQKNVTSFTGKYNFLETFEYTLGADQLTEFGQQQLVNSGIKYYERYQVMTKHWTPFVRSSSEDRVVESAQNWTQGYHSARLADKSSTAKDTYPYPIVVISEADGSNNTLNHGLCTAFEDGPDSELGDDAQATFNALWVPAVAQRLMDEMPGAQLTTTQTIYLMDMCPFVTMASPTGEISDFCSLFTETEWHYYDYYQSLGKYYGYGPGNPLGPTNGVGWTNELIARLTNKPVVDHTSVNHTLDASQTTFPIAGGHVLYADFSHDNDMTAIFSAMGLFNTTALAGGLPTDHIVSAASASGYSAAWTVAFAARMYVEKMSCSNEPEEMVRILIDDRVIPLDHLCGGNALGLCTLSKFVESQSFAREGGLWNECFA